MTGRKKLHRKPLYAVPLSHLSELIWNPNYRSGVPSMSEQQLYSMTTTKGDVIANQNGVAIVKYPDCVAVEMEGFELSKAIMERDGLFTTMTEDVTESIPYNSLESIIRRNGMELTGRAWDAKDGALLMTERYENGKNPPYGIRIDLSYLNRTDDLHATNVGMPAMVSVAAPAAKN